MWLLHLLRSLMSSLNMLDYSQKMVQNVISLSCIMNHWLLMAIKSRSFRKFEESFVEVASVGVLLECCTLLSLGLIPDPSTSLYLQLASNLICLYRFFSNFWISTKQFVGFHSDSSTGKNKNKQTNKQNTKKTPFKTFF